MDWHSKVIQLYRMNEYRLRALQITIRLSQPELERAHAIAAAGDETISRFVRRTILREYEMRFGNAEPHTLSRARASISPDQPGISYDEAKKVGS